MDPASLLDRDPPLLDSYDKYRTTPWRWFILFYFSVSNCNQCLAWFSFSSTDQDTMQGYFGKDMDKFTIDLLLNWGPIVGAACFPLSSWLMQQPGGLRKSMWVGIILVFAGSLLRAVPLMVAAAAQHARPRYAPGRHPRADAAESQPHTRGIPPRVQQAPS